MSPTLKLWIIGTGASIQEAFEYIIPEFPVAGVAACFVCALLFVFYLFKQGLKHALKISLMIFILLVFAMYAFHSIVRVFHLIH